MEKIIGIFIIILLIGTVFPAIAIMNEPNNQLKEIPESFFPHAEIIFKLRENITNSNLEYEYITRDKIIEIAEAYTNYEWYPTIDNILHGECVICGERVDTVDRDYYSNWFEFCGWNAGQLNIGIPYKADGFSSISGFNLTNPEDFYEQYTGTGAYEGAIHYGGDIYFEKPEPCSRACGIDCSGFVSRCWNLPEKHYTFSGHGVNGLPNVSSPIRYNELKPGDLIDWANYPRGHAILFKEFIDEDTIIVIDQGGVAWQVAEFTCDVTFISDDGFYIRLEGSYYDYTENFGNELFEIRQYKFISNTPSTPTIEGSTNGRTGIEYNYSFAATDPDEDDIYYCIEWGDSVEELGPNPSGETVTVKHNWSQEGLYCLRVKAKDINGLESGWGTLEISMPKTKSFNDYNPWLNRLIQRFPILKLMV